MDFLKKFLIFLIPTCLTITLISYGISIIFNDLSLTYFTQEMIAHEPRYIFNWSQYLNNLKIDQIAEKVKQAFENVGEILDPLDGIKSIWADGYDFGDIILTTFNGFAILINIIIYLLNTVLYIIQIIIILAQKLFSILGINISSNNIINNLINSFTSKEGINFIDFINKTNGGPVTTVPIIRPRTL